MHFSRVALLASTCLFIVTACGSSHPEAPSAPSDDIALAPAPASPIELTTITCTGPEAEVAALGALCDDDDISHRIGSPLSAMGYLGDRYDGAILILVGFAPTGTLDDGESHTWEATEVRTPLTS